jgi:phospholipid transport system transporter-binding protein
MIVRQGNRVQISGPVTLENVATLVAESAVFEGESVIVDLSGLSAADSSALSLMLEWARRFGGAGKRIEFANLSAGLRSLAELYGVLDLIPIANT